MPLTESFSALCRSEGLQHVPFLPTVSFFQERIRRFLLHGGPLVFLVLNGLRRSGAIMIQCLMFVSDMATSTDNQARIALFQSIGLNEQKARETLKNNDVTRSLEATINEVKPE